MKKVCGMLVLGVVVASVFGAVLLAEDAAEGALRGTFVRLVERAVGEREYLGIVVKPFEGDDHVTVLVARRQEELIVAARKLREGQKVEIEYVAEAGHNWVKGFETEWRPEAEEVDSPLERAVKYIQIFKPLKPLTPYKLMEQIEKMHARLAELKEAAEHAEREGQYDKTAELRKKARRIAEQLEAHTHAFAFEFRQARKLHEAKKHLERLRHKAHAAQERGEAEKAKHFMVEAEELEQALRHEFEHLETANSLERLRLMAHEAEERGEMEKARDILADAEGLEGLRRELERREGEREKPERKRPVVRDVERRREGERERPEARRPWVRLEQMEGQLREAIAAHFERMRREFRVLLGRVEQLEKEVRGLRAENERLKRALRESGRLTRERREEGLERRDRGERREGEERREREERREVRIRIRKEVGVSLPAGMRGFRGVLVGTVSRKLDRGFLLKVEKLGEVWEQNKADNPRAAVGKELRIVIRSEGEGGERFLRTLRGLERGDRVIVEAFHFEGNHLTVVEQLKKSD